MVSIQVVKSLGDRVKLADGNSIPQLGLGVYEMNEKETYESVKCALQAGYKHIDTAEWYENEAPCGKAINEYLETQNVPEESIFLTSKLKDLRSYDHTLSDLRASLKRTGVAYFDMYLLHSAIGGPQVRKECWRACVQAQKEGLVKSIGVSNWGTKHIQELIDNGSVLPVVNQIDLHPFMRHPDIVKICQDNGILLEAWGPLARAMRFDHPSIQKVAKAQGKSQAQIFLRWGLQHGFIVIPKSVSEGRIISNSEVFDFELSPSEMEEMTHVQLDGLDEYLVTDWDVVDCA